MAQKTRFHKEHWEKLRLCLARSAGEPRFAVKCSPLSYILRDLVWTSVSSSVRTAILFLFHGSLLPMGWGSESRTTDAFGYWVLTPTYTCLTSQSTAERVSLPFSWPACPLNVLCTPQPLSPTLTCAFSLIQRALSSWAAIQCCLLSAILSNHPRLFLGSPVVHSVPDCDLKTLG